MEAIEQLKTMRDRAKARIEASPDYKLMTKLTTLIDELETVLTEPQENDGADNADASEDEETVEEDHSAAEAETLEAELSPASEPEPVEPPTMAPPVVEPPSRSSGPVALDPNATSVLDELERLTGSLRDGEAQHEVEQTPEIHPFDEIAEDIALHDDGEDYQEQDYSDEEASLDADLAIMRALPQLEADLNDAYLEMQDDEEER